MPTMQLLAERSSHLYGKIYQIALISPIGLTCLISKLSLMFLDIFSPLCTSIHTFDCHSFIAILGIWWSECPLHIIQNCLLLLVYEFYVNIKLLISMKMTVGILMGVAFSLQVILGNTVILIILILLTDKHSTLFY